MGKHLIPQREVSESAASPGGFSVDDVFLILAGLLILLRITIWKFFPACEVFVREDLSNILVAALILLLVSAWLIRKVIRQELVSPSGLEIPVLIFLGAAIGSLSYTVDFSASLTGVPVLFAYVAFFFMLQDVLKARGRARNFLFFLIACAVLVACYGIRDFIFLSQRPVLPTDQAIARTNESLYYILVNRRVTSFLGWPNTLAGYLMLFLPLTAAFVITLKERWQRILFVAGFLAMAACYVFTFSFLGWLSFLIATVILFVSSWKRLKVRGWPRGRRIALLLIATVFLVLFAWVIARKDFAAALAPRVEYYKAAVALVKAKPLFGHGWNAFEVASRKYAYSQSALSAYVHNSYLQAWVETGLLGLISLILLFWFFARMSRTVLLRKEVDGDQLLLWAMIWGFFAFFIDNVFSFTILKPNISLHFWVMLAVFAALCRKTKDLGKYRSLRPWYLLAPVLIALVAVYVLFRMAAGFWNYQTGMQAFRRGDLGVTEQRLSRAQEWDPWRSQFRAGLGQIYLKAYFTTGQTGYFDRAEAQYWQAANRSPLSYGNYFILSKLYERHGDKNKAEQLARVARSLSPYQFEHDLKVLADMAKKRNLTNGGGP